MKHDFWQALRGYAIAVATVLMTCLVWVTSTTLIGNRVSSSFFLMAVVIVSRFAGYGPSWLALILGAVPVTYSQYLRLGLSDPAALTIIIVYFLLGSIMVWVMQSERIARQTAERSAADALHKQGLLEREIAERKAIEQQLREQQQQLQEQHEQLELALKAGRLGIWSWDMRTGQVRSTETQAIIHGHSPDKTELSIEESIGNIHPDDRHVIKQAMERSLRDETLEGVTTYRTVWPDSSIRWVESFGKVFHDESGAPNRVLGVSSDITEKKVAEDVVRASEARLQGILDNTTAVIYLKDNEGRYITVNRRWEELFHVKREQIAGRTGVEVFSNEVVARLKTNDDRVRQAGHPLEFEEIIPLDGKPHTYISVKFPIKDANGVVVAVGGISTDISELKRTTEALIAERELLKNMIEIQENEKQFICYDIHDGLIQYVAGALMLVEGFTQTHPAMDGSTSLDKAVTSLRRAVAEGRRVIRGVRSHVLDYSGVVAGIEDLIHEASTDDLIVEFDEDDRIGRLPKPLETAIYRVVQEALTNAKKHSGSERVQIDLRLAEGQVRVEIRDFGCGFNVKAVGRNAFGLLGMTERVRLLGGQCTIQSEPGKGTQVIATFPIAAGAASEQRLATQNEP